jgi:hypothetical protein
MTNPKFIKDFGIYENHIRFHLTYDPPGIRGVGIRYACSGSGSAFFSAFAFAVSIFTEAPSPGAAIRPGKYEFR